MAPAAGSQAGRPPPERRSLFGEVLPSLDGDDDDHKHTNPQRRSTSSVPDYQHGRRSRFIEESMRNRPSIEPPSFFTGGQDAAPVVAGDEHAAGNEPGHRHSGVYRLGKAIANALNPVRAGSGKERRGTTVDGNELDLTRYYSPEVYAQHYEAMNGQPYRQYGSNTGTPRIPAVASIAAESPLKHVRSASLASLRKVRSRLLLPGLGRRATSPLASSPSDRDPTASLDLPRLRAQPSRRDLQRARKLNKKISNLEARLQRARRELQSTVRDDEPRDDPPPIVPLPTKPFLPGALPSLPSQQVLGAVGVASSPPPQRERARQPDTSLSSSLLQVRGNALVPKTRSVASKKRKSANPLVVEEPTSPPAEAPVVEARPRRSSKSRKLKAGDSPARGDGDDNDDNDDEEARPTRDSPDRPARTTTTTTTTTPSPSPAKAIQPSEGPETPILGRRAATGGPSILEDAASASDTDATLSVRRPRLSPILGSDSEDNPPSALRPLPNQADRRRPRPSPTRRPHRRHRDDPTTTSAIERQAASGAVRAMKENVGTGERARAKGSVLLQKLPEGIEADNGGGGGGEGGAGGYLDEEGTWVWSEDVF